MRLSPLLAAGILLLVTIVPAAAATGECISQAAVVACAGDHGTYTGCYEEGEFSSENTGVFVATPAGSLRAGGYHSCSNYCFPFFGCVRSESRGVGASVGLIVVGQAGLSWSSAYGSCYTTLYAYTVAGGQALSVGCPAGPPPAQPWGHVLP